MSSEPESQVVVIDKIPAGESGLIVRDHTDLYRFCEQVSKADLIPAHLHKKPADAFLVAAAGMALGFDPFISMLQGYVVKGRPAWPGQMFWSKIQMSADLDWIDHGFEGSMADETRSCWIQTKRKSRDKPHPKTEYTLDHAKQAELYPGQKDRNGNWGVWVRSTDDMLFWKAVAREVRRNWPEKAVMAPIAEDMPGWRGQDAEPEVEVKDISPAPPAAEVSTTTTPPASQDPARALLEMPPEASETPQEPAAPEPEPEPSEPEKPQEAPEEGEETAKKCHGCGKTIRRDHSPVTVKVEGEDRDFHKKCAEALGPDALPPAGEPDPEDEPPPPEEEGPKAQAPATAPEASAAAETGSPEASPEPEPPDETPVEDGFGIPREKLNDEELEQIQAAIRRRVEQFAALTDSSKKKAVSLIEELFCRKGREGPDDPPLSSLRHINPAKLEKALSVAANLKIDASGADIEITL